MGLIGAVARQAARGAHVLIVEVPGWSETRMLLEAELDRRGWKSGLSPADADILAVCGVPGDELLAVCDHLWDQLPGPRARVHIVSAALVDSSLDSAAAALIDDPMQRRDARERTRAAVVPTRDGDEHAGMDHGAMDHSKMDHGAMDYSKVDHSAMDHSKMDHSKMDHSKMDHSKMAGMDHAGMDHGGMDHAGMDHSKMDHSKMDHSKMAGMDHAGMDHGGMDHAGMDHSKMDHSKMAGMDHAGMDHSKMDHGGMDHAAMDHSKMDHSKMAGMDHGAMAGMDHAGMDHAGMDMPMPGGIPLAGGGDDRDGLEMDVLNVPLGPVLPHWPAGLVVDCVLQGDVIVEATARVVDAGAPADAETVGGGRRGDVIRRCDFAAQLLALAGWTAAAQDARRVRDALLSGSDISKQEAALDRLRRRVEHSALLRWSLKGIGAGDGDIRARLIGWLREATESARSGEGSLSPARAVEDLAALPELIRGADLGTARLLIAGLGLDTATLTPTSAPPKHPEKHGSAHG